MTDPNHEQNRKLWDELADVHYRHPDYRVDDFLNGWNSLKPIERRLLPDVRGKSLLHLFCQFGLDTLSWVRLGADATGVDISGRSIELASQLKTAAGLPAAFVQSDILDLVGKIEHSFDCIVQTYGTHHWISDLDRWAATVAHYLRPGGRLLLVDIHPIVPVLFDRVPYFEREPKRYHDPDYADKSYLPSEESVEWQHTLGDIITALVNAGLVINHLEEFPGLCYRYRNDWVERDGYWYPPDGPTLYPMLFALTATRGR